MTLPVLGADSLGTLQVPRLFSLVVVALPMLG